MKQNCANKKLKDFCSILNGFAFKSQEYVESGIRVIRITNVQKGFIVDDDPKFYPLSSKNSLTNYLLRKDDLLMSLTGNVGRVGILSEDFLPAALNQRVACLRIDESIINKRYLFHILNSDKFERECVFNATGIAQKNMSTKWLGEYQIPVPPLDEQQRIVAELDLLTEVIDKRKMQLKELDTLAQSIFYDMFGDPIENPKGWDVKKFCDICEVTSSKRVYQSEWQSTGIPFLRISDFSQLIENNGDINAELFISKEKYDELKLSDQVPSAGDILVTARGTLGVCYIVKKKDCFYFQDGMITWLKNLDMQVLSQFIVFLFKNHSFRRQIDKSQSGSTVAYLSISMLKKFILPVPPLALQQSFADKILSIEKQKTAINQSIAETQKLLDYTMDKYFG